MFRLCHELHQARKVERLLGEPRTFVARNASTKLECSEGSEARHRFSLALATLRYLRVPLRRRMSGTATLKA